MRADRRRPMLGAAMARSIRPTRERAPLAGLVVLTGLAAAVACDEASPAGAVPFPDAVDASTSDGRVDDATTSLAETGGPDGEAEASARTVIGPDGGVVHGPDDVTATIPPGALAADTSFRIEAVVAPGADGGSERIYRFLPPIVFARPVTVDVPAPAGRAEAALQWSRVGGLGGYDPLCGAVTAGRLRAAVVHFGGGYASEKGATRAVVGANVRVHLASSFERHVPRQLSGTPFTVTATAPDGGVLLLPGQGYGDATFRVADVPYGPFVLRWASTDYDLRDDECALDLGRAVDGRPDVALSMPASATTTVTFDATDLEPWEARSTLDLFSTEAGLAALSVQTDPAAKNAPLAGATTLTKFQVPTRERSSSAARRIEGARGDRAHLFQLAARTTSTGATALTLVKELDAPPFDATFGTDAPIAGAFAAVPLDRTLEIAVKVSAAWAVPSDFGSGVTPESGNVLVSVRAQPFTARHGHAETAPRLVQLRVLSSPMGTDVTTGTLSYGLPLVGQWAPLVEVSLRAAKDYALPGNAAVSHVVDAFFEGRALPNAPGPATLVVTPSVSPPYDFRINAAPWSTPTSGVGVSPLVEWTAPRTGQAAGYRAFLFELGAAGGVTVPSYVATLDTPRPSLRIPPGLLVAGKTYFLEVRARHRPAVDLARAPERDELPTAEATHLTETFSP